MKILLADRIGVAIRLEHQEAFVGRHRRIALDTKRVE
jgi:hypothetical protein